MKSISLTQGKVALVDDEDFERLNQFSWCASRNRRIFYATRLVRDVGGKKRTVFMHRVIMDAPKGMEIDHKNQDGLDNRKFNLRLCSFENNIRNQAGNMGSTSRFKGVSWSRECQKWRARLRSHKKDYHGGVFTNEVEAAKAYDLLAKRFFGGFAYLNFPSRENEVAA